MTHAVPTIARDAKDERTKSIRARPPRRMDTAHYIAVRSSTRYCGAFERHTWILWFVTTRAFQASRKATLLPNRVTGDRSACIDALRIDGANRNRNRCTCSKF